MSNDYNISKIGSEVIVSRTLQAKNYAYQNVIWRTGKPPLDSEWNLLNDVMMEPITTLLRTNTYSGWLNLGGFDSSNVTANLISYFTNEDQAVIDIPNAVVNGLPLIVGGVNYTDTSKNKITLPAAGTTARYDFVFLEVWKTMVRSRDTNNNPISYHKPDTTHVYAYGNTQFGGTNLVDDIIDTAIKPSVNGIETSERVQLQYRIRVASGVSFPTTLSDGFSDVTVQGQGANVNPQATLYEFTNMGTVLGDKGLWRAGAGTDASRTALQTVDGYTYAIPMFKIFRRNTNVWVDENNQDGGASNAAPNERPDGKTYSMITSDDIIDLRYKVSLSGIDCANVLESNLDTLLKGTLVSARQKKLQYDSISDSGLSPIGYTDFLSNEGCSGKRTIWSDTATVQTKVTSILNINTLTDITADVYREANVGSAWQNGDIIHIQPTTKILGGTIVNPPVVKINDKLNTTISLSWTTDMLVSGAILCTLSAGDATAMGSHDLWITYDISLPEAKGVSHVPENLLRVNYVNAPANVVAGFRHDPITTRFQDFFNHPVQTTVGGNVLKEVAVTKERKQVQFTPLITTTNSRLESKATDGTAKTVYVPYDIQHIKGIYTSITGGVEIARKPISSPAITVNVADNSFSVPIYICELTDVVFNAQSLIIALGYKPVYKHTATGTTVSLYDASGTPYPTALSASLMSLAGYYMPVSNGTSWGFTIGGNVINCTGSTNVGNFPADEQSVFVDMDYFGAAHKGAELRLIYEYIPYQGLGSDIVGQTVKHVYHRNKGIAFNNGTGGSVASTYTPISPKLPGDKLDYRRNGQAIAIGSMGVARSTGDAWFYSAYDVYSGALLDSSDKLIPTVALPLQNGIDMSAIIPVEFEVLTTSTTYAGFALPLLVKNKATGELLMMIQVSGNTGNMLGTTRVEFYRLNEKYLVK